MNVILTGGGTGGHLYPGMAIAQELERRISCNIAFVGTKRGIESRVIPQTDYGFKTVSIQGLHRGRFFRNLMFPLRMIISFIQATIIILSFRPRFIIGTGGYVSWPVLAAGLILRKKLFIQEQNMAPGLVTRLFARYAKSVFLSYEESKRFFKRQDNLLVSGNPTRADLDFDDRQKGYAHFNLNPEKPVLLVFGGSQGALGLNQAVEQSIDELMECADFQVVWSTGPLWFESLKKIQSKHPDRIRIVPYIDEMNLAYAVTDLLLCRSGATTVAEVTRLGIPAVYVPFPGAASGHQEENARILVEAGASEMVLEKDAKMGKLNPILIELWNDKDRRSDMREKTRALGHPDAAEKVVDSILNTGDKI